MSARLADVGTWRSGGTPPKDRDELWDGGFPWISTRDLKQPELNGSTDTITEDAAKRFSTTVPAGSLLIGTRGMALAKRLPVAMVTRAVAFNQDIKAIEPYGDVCSKYLLYALLAFERPILALTDEAAHGTKRLDTDLLRAFRIPCPPRREQERIADFLDAETARIDALASNVHRLLRLIAERLDCETSRVLASESMEPRPLHHAVERVEVGVVVQPAALYAASGIPFLRGVNITPGKIVLDDLKYLDPAKEHIAAKSTLREGDVVVVRTGQAGAAAVVFPELDGANCVDLLIVRPGPDLVPRYLELLLNSEVVRSQVATMTVGSIQSHFNVGALREVLIRVPGIARQDEIVREADLVGGQHRQLLAAGERQIALLRERRQAIITAAVTGQLQVPERTMADAAA